MRQLQYISQFSTNICHISGSENIVADQLSRIADVSISVIDYDKIAEKQVHDKDLQDFQAQNKTLNFKSYLLSSGKNLWCDTFPSNIRPFIPKKFRMDIFQQIHGLAHPGIKSTVKEMTSKFIWPNIKKDIQTWSRACIGCPYSSSDNFVYCLTCIDRYTGWMEAIPLRDITAETVARAFYEHCITRFGVAYQVIMDRGAQFTSELFRTLWSESIPTILLGLRAALKEDSGYSIAQMVYRKRIKLSGEFFDKPTVSTTPQIFLHKLQKQMELFKLSAVQRKMIPKVFVHKDLNVCSHVFLRTDRVKKPLEPLEDYGKPFKVLKRMEKYFLLQIKGKEVNISIDRLKPAYCLVSGEQRLEPETSDTQKKTQTLLKSENNDERPRVSRTGRLIKRPLRFSNNVEYIS
ncbi:uncharacterized protein LOC118198462 [Stegodyphus dumicola]|uniref:uncharacterized protein LOC118198462 n=1 Tax=Stegodyphus dumicola TaxID=202533 RepID=UPI0015AEEC90|nr:uncharacterized protein LOC118198462 [Stegodyphus dumicola]